jgi:hypothetical protein
MSRVVAVTHQEAQRLFVLACADADIDANTLAFFQFDRDADGEFEAFALPPRAADVRAGVVIGSGRETLVTASRAEQGSSGSSWTLAAAQLSLAQLLSSARDCGPSPFSFMTRHALDRLRAALHHKNLVPVVGAGVSIGAAGLPSWSDLITCGVTHLENQDHDPATVTGIRSLVQADTLLAAAGPLQAAISGRDHEHWKSNNYAAWLETVFGDPDVTDTAILHRLRQLNARVIVTTNYDRILETHVKPGASSLTWQQSGALRTMLRAGEGVAYLHGRYDRPASVILSPADYQRIVDDRVATRVAQTLFESGLLMFVGVSPAGADDPHLAKLLDHFVELQDVAADHDEPYPHVLLHAAEDGIKAEDVTQLRRRGVEAFEYGKTRADLEPFLQDLARRERLVVPLDEVSRVLKRVGRAGSVEAAVRNAVTEINRWVYPGRDVSVTYAEGAWVRDATAPPEAPERFVTSEYPCTFHYPISVAGWAMAEAQPIAWPLERHRSCGLDRIRKLGRLADLESAIAAAVADGSSPLRGYVNLEEIQDKFAQDTLTIGDLFQDWSNLEDNGTFVQFLSIPVPQIETSTTRGVGRARGVFNVDSRDTVPLNDPIAAEKLRLIGELVFGAYVQEGLG